MTIFLTNCSTFQPVDEFNKSSIKKTKIKVNKKSIDDNYENDPRNNSDEINNDEMLLLDDHRETFDFYRE